MEAQHYRETVCEKCPGTKWGKTSRCNVHGKHIGQVDTCPQWEAATAGQFPPDDMEFVQQVEEWVRDYHWMAVFGQTYYEIKQTLMEKLATLIQQQEGKSGNAHIRC